MRYRIRGVLTALIFLFSATGTACAAEPVMGILIPSQSLVTDTQNDTVTTTAWLGHPFTLSAVSMDKPRIYAAIAGEKPIDLRNRIQPLPVHNATGWSNTLSIRDPGQFIFFVEEDPVLNPETGHMTAQLVKTYVNAYGSDAPFTPELAMKAEIVPLTCPYGQPTGSLFQAVLKKDETVVPLADVSAVLYNPQKKIKPLVENHISFKLKTNSDGAFSFVAPRAGWWGFYSTVSAGYTTKVSGNDVPVDFAAILWVEFHDWK